MFSKIFFEISGFCNGKCPWCSTGNQSLGSKYPSRFIEPGDFEKAIIRLGELRLMNSETLIFPFNRGEPLLHPDLNEILKILNKRNIPFAISTNASKVVKMEHDLLTNMCRLVISMPGFSQASYDRIHGFNFYQILHNIDRLLKNCKEAGFRGPVHLSYHIYQFNIGEIKPARDFCSQKHIEFLPRSAYPQDLNLSESYLNNTLSYEMLRKMSEELLLYYVEDRIASAPKNYTCPQHYNYLAIDEFCNVLTCCGIPKGHPDYSIGNLFELSAEEIQKRKVSQNICKECIDSGLAYWGHNPLIPNFVDDICARRSYGADLFSFIKKYTPIPLKNIVKKAKKKPKKLLKKYMKKKHRVS